MKAAYEHMTDRKEVKKNFRDEDGAVVIGPRNFFTNPPKKGEVGKGTSFAG
jgi:NAD/NADP transhydrogenase beta subunit